MRRPETSGLVSAAVLTVALLAAAACRPAEEETETEISEPVELQFDYALAIEDDRAPEGLRRVGKDFRFRSGDRFVLQFRPGFEAYAYVFHRAQKDPSFAMLFPHRRIGLSNPLPAHRISRVPDGQLRWTLDQERGIEHLVLVVSSGPWELEHDSPGKIPRDLFEQRIAELEMRRSPASSSTIEEDGWTRLFFDGQLRDAALVVRLPLSHL